MKKAISVILAIIILSIYPNATVSSGSSSNALPEIYAESCILVDAVTGNVLYEKNADKEQHPASTTKIMTAVLAIEGGYCGKNTVVSRDAVALIGVNGSNAGLRPGETVSYDDLLHMALISSANDAANAIAEGVSGDISEFVALMNDKASELGLVNTHFSNPVGLDSGDGYPDHKTTARELAEVMRYCSSKEIFRDIAGKSRYMLPVTNFHQSSRGFRTTTDALLTDPRFASDDYAVVGGKTGYTRAAQNVFTACARNADGIELILVLMKEPERSVMFRDASMLFDYGFSLVESDESLAESGFYDVRYRTSENTVNSFYQAGYLNGDDKGRFNYAGTVSREEFIETLGNVSGGFAVGSCPASSSHMDEAIADGLAAEAWADAGDLLMTRGEMITVLSRLVGADPDIEELLAMIGLISDLDGMPVSLRWDTFRVYKAGLISGRADGSIGADEYLTREEMVLVINNYMEYMRNATSLMRML